MRAAVSRADLLLALADPALPALRLAALLRFVPAPPPPIQPLALPAAQPSPPVQPAAPIAPDEPPLQANRLQADMAGITLVQPLDTVLNDVDAPTAAGPVQVPESSPRTPGPVPSFVPLVRAARLWPALRQSLTLLRPAGIDWHQLTHDLVQGRAPTRLPLAGRRVWGGQLWIVIDTSPRLRPFAADFDQLLRLIGRLRGSTGLAIWTVRGRPDQVLGSTLHPVANPGHALLPLPPPGTVVLMLSDLGSLARDGAAEAAWQACAQRLAQANALPVAWLPVAPAQVGQALAQSLPVHCLQAGKALRRQAGRWATREQRQAERLRLDKLLEALCVRAACCVQLDPALLRALRQTSPGLRREPALEALYWTLQPIVRASEASRPLAPDATARFRARLGDIAPAEQLAVLAAMLHHHGHHARSTEAVEASLWQAHTSVPAPQWPADLAQCLQAASQWLGQLAHSVARPSPSAPASQGFVRDLLDRQGQDLAWQALNSWPLANLWASAGLALPPPGIAPVDLLAAQRHCRPAAAARHWQLLQRGRSLVLWPAGQALPPHASPWGVQVMASAVLVAPRAGPRQWLALDDSSGQAPLPLLDLCDGSLPAELSFAGTSLVVGPLPRPSWAIEWGRDPQGLYALGPTPWGPTQRLYRWITTDDQGYGPRPGTVSRQQAPASAVPAVAKPARPMVLISASHQDQRWLDQLLRHLGPLERLGTLSLWHDRSVPGGSVWQQQFDAALQASQAVVMLVSTAYVMSEHVLGREWPSILARRRAGNFSVLPILLDTCDWRLLPGLEAFQFVDLRQGLGSQPGAYADASLAALARQVSRLVETQASAPSVVAANAAAEDRALLQLGADSAYGLFADLQANGLTQRFRYLPPGDFSMGSPDHEPGHYSDESPCHPVRLTESFWLADTACTQALWQAVMGGKNPSHFKGDDQRPVESVSFDDVQQFLARLQPLLPPGCQAVLPTEAQWEYACRAGSSTAFNTGTQISRETVNFDAAQDTPLAGRGEESKSTVPVKSLPPNAWGLYEMHGNVWEWCADAWRDYAATVHTAAPLEDPTGPPEQGPEAPRAVRGGSWFFPAGGARSAYRGHERRGFRIRGLGFRLALRSTSPEAPEGRQPGAVAGPEAPPAARRDAEPRNLMGRVVDSLLGRKGPPAAAPPPPTRPKKPKR